MINLFYEIIRVINELLDENDELAPRRGNIILVFEDLQVTVVFPQDRDLVLQLL